MKIQSMVVKAVEIGDMVEVEVLDLNNNNMLIVDHKLDTSS